MLDECFFVFSLVCSTQEMCGAGGREVHWQAGGCGIDVITHLAEGKRWSVTVNNQMALHHQTHFPPLRLFMQPLGWLQAKTGNISVFYLLDADFICWTQRLLDFRACPPEVRRENKQQKSINSLLRFEDEFTAANFHFLPLKRRKRSSEHCCITADNKANCSASAQLELKAWTRPSR